MTTDSAQIQQIQSCVEFFEQHPDAEIRDRGVELLRAVMDLHGSCLSRIMGVIADRGEILDALAHDESVSGLLMLYGLHPLPLQERVDKALEDLSPMLKHHKAGVDLLSIDEGVVRLRLTTNGGGGCHSSAATIKDTINETMLAAAPDIVQLLIEEVTEPQVFFVPLESLSKPKAVSKQVLPVH
jgi:Fe-S cluster biogenesis protein NfuA